MFSISLPLINFSSVMTVVATVRSILGRYMGGKFLVLGQYSVFVSFCFKRGVKKVCLKITQ